MIFTKEVLASWARHTGVPATRGTNRGSADAFYADLIPSLTCNVPLTLEHSGPVIPASLKLLRSDFQDAFNAAIKPKGGAGAQIAEFWRKPL